MNSILKRISISSHGFSVLTKAEVDARAIIQFHAWTEQVLTEARALNNLVSLHIVPSGLKQQKLVADSVRSVKELGIQDIDVAEQLDLLSQVTQTLNSVISENKQLGSLLASTKHSHDPESSEQIAIKVRDTIKPLMSSVRASADLLETMVNDCYWTLPKYQEILFFK